MRQIQLTWSVFLNFFVVYGILAANKKVIPCPFRLLRLAP